MWVDLSIVNKKALFSSNYEISRTAFVYKQYLKNERLCMLGKRYKLEFHKDLNDRSRVSLAQYFSNAPTRTSVGRFSP